ncbi:MAG: exodeoxyribonuclease VII large subunit [Methanobrevibacter sp.]|uniref:exodeoxyribonuclease VII large subunit n=1 Tax=Methanobrevibacter sp. TaxID=66852 RepID=UPI0025E0D181|nr:exodeoxyribonuclease VII large subunit [Methanobrevibacter sp.]MBQ2612542.1 exodeoxyribonuclease VII large subunit [Methanobrevibacter sp.]MEE0025555.1 exodeoxyribonuclease VII large subunit [Methanobrevibacter sp.]
MDKEYITVSKITDYIARLIGSDSNLKHVFIKGELSNVNLYRSGHLYFTLKDENSQIKGVMFNARRRLKFKPEDGMKVLIEGKIDVYKINGVYQLYVSEISKDGIGDLHRRFEELKEKLNKEGLFDQSHKKKIPNFPKRIGVITAANGAAIRDIIITIKRRWPLCEVILFPSLVQGEKASQNIVYQIKNADKFDLDTLIVGRGGGSIEDLWSFNEEIVARAIYECETPVISAVGHEIDFTISDFVADLRAATPTAAAEIAAPPYVEIKNGVNQLDSRANLAINKILDENKNKLDNIISKRLFTSPGEIYAPKEMMLDGIINRLQHSSESLIMKNQNRLDLVKNSNVFKNPQEIIKNQKENYLLQLSKLEILNPLNTLKRGYTLAKSDGKLISSAKQLKSGDNLEVEFEDGNVNTKVI